MSPCRSVCSYVCLCLSVYLSVCMSVCLCICLSFCLIYYVYIFLHTFALLASSPIAGQFYSSCLLSLRSSTLPQCYVMLCYMIICIAPLTGIYSEALSACEAGEKIGLQITQRETRAISPVASQSGMQGECHSRVQGPLQQRPGFGIEKYWTKVHEDHSDQQSAAGERSEQIAV